MAELYLSFFSLILLIPFSLLLLLYFIVHPKPVWIPIKKRHVLITGGSSGIGLALARLCAQQGAEVTLVARNVSKLEEAKHAIKLATGREVRVFSADVRDYDAVKRVVEEAGPIDVLVCNQGVYVPQELEEQDMEEIKFMIDVNLMGTFHLIKAALPGMKKNRAERGPASIAIMSSQAGQVGIYGYTAYSASKFGLKGLAEALQHEIIADDIHVSLIFPPDTETPGFAEEHKRRPQLTTVIAASSGAMKATEVAKKSLNGIQSGTFIIPCNFEGFLLSLTTAVLVISPHHYGRLVAIPKFSGRCRQINRRATRNGVHGHHGNPQMGRVLVQAWYLEVRHYLQIKLPGLRRRRFPHINHENRHHMAQSPVPLHHPQPPTFY